MKMKLPKHNIDGAFILVLFAVFAVTIVSVLALGANSYKNLVERDDDAYNKRIITSYITAKIRNHDSSGAVTTGGFAKPGEPDGIETLHLYQTIEGQKFDMRIYFYNGYIYELFTTADNEIEPEAGNKIMEAKGLSFTQDGTLIRITAVDADGRTGTASVALRSDDEEVVS
jgi:hypothetical protein